MKLSELGMGAMRLPTMDGNDTGIDESETSRMIKFALENSVNYFDTAWGCHGGQSETAMGKLLSQYPRDSFFLASKFPGYDVSNMHKAGEIFEEQLKKSRVDHFDFYPFHNVCELNIDAYLHEKYGILDYLLRQKACIIGA